MVNRIFYDIFKLLESEGDTQEIINKDRTAAHIIVDPQELEIDR